ncbi:MAG: tetratricopeptide repeat protein [Rhodospirillales bacterium]|nr:tetratricopeptide repeat protein [Rhodospirillales bacterium]
MNRAERRRQKKLSDKAVKTAKTGASASALSGPPTVAIQQALNLAIQHLRDASTAEAKTAFQQVLEIDPEQPVALQFLGVISHQQGDSDSAVELIRRAIAVKPDYADAHSNLGLVLKARGDLDEAVTSYRQAVATKPDHADALFNLGNLLKLQEKQDEAVVSYRRALAVRPDHVDTHYNLAATLHELGQLEDAKASYQKALALKPDFADALSNLGNVFLDQGQLDRAVTSYRQALMINPDYADAHNNLGNALKQLDKPDEAAIHYRKALSVNPDYADAHSNLGALLQKSGMLDEAAASYQAALAVMPDHVEANNNLGNVLAEMGKGDEAIASYNKAIAIKPDYAEAHNNLGNVLKAQGRHAEAVASYHRAISIDPDDADAHNNLGNAHQEMDALDDAVASYRAALAVNPDHLEAHCNLGAALYELGELDAAIAGYRRALSINPDYADAHYNLGIVLQELGRELDAFDCHRRAATLNPENTSAWAGMARALRAMVFSSVDNNLLQDLLHVLEHPTVNPGLVVNPILSALHCLPGFTRLVEQAAAGDRERPSFTDCAARLSSIPLFLRLISLCPVNDLAIEAMLTRLRHDLLEMVAADDADAGDSGDGAALPFAMALALHCFTNEYVYAESAEEAGMVAALARRITARVRQNQDIPALALAALAAFRPLHGLDGAEQLLALKDQDAVGDLIRRQISEPLAERTLRPQIPRLTAIENRISQSVRAQYEENPYPRWVHTGQSGKAQVIADALQKAPLLLDLGDYQSPAKPEILIAGCGTGQLSLNTQSRFKDAEVLAIDLSLSSLSYASRKTREMGITAITYGQADIMELGGLGRQFDMIESVGVLHHLGDPLAGWQVLVDLLRPGGLMRIGLYSELARKAVIDGRALIADRGYTTSPDDIRRCRQEIIGRVASGDRALAKVLNMRDFYSLSECRDLLFHVHEHNFTLPQIADALARLELTFLGFEIENPHRLRLFEDSYPEQTPATALALWHQFEQDNPDTFQGMYQFWCRKT